MLSGNRFNQAVKNPDPTIEEALSISFNFKSTFFMDQIHVQLQDLYEEKIESLTESSTKANEIKKRKDLFKFHTLLLLKSEGFFVFSFRKVCFLNKVLSFNLKVFLTLPNKV